MTAATALPLADRPRLAEAYRRLRDRTGLGHWLVRAYVVAAYHRSDAAEAMARAHFGQPLDQLGPGAREAAAYWVRRLDACAGTARPAA
jgi:hypothetical protein